MAEAGQVAVLQNPREIDPFPLVRLAVRPQAVEWEQVVVRVDGGGLVEGLLDAAVGGTLAGQDGVSIGGNDRRLQKIGPAACRPQGNRGGAKKKPTVSSSRSHNLH
jgi:hypothetical protein